MPNTLSAAKRKEAIKNTSAEKAKETVSSGTTSTVNKVNEVASTKTPTTTTTTRTKYVGETRPYVNDPYGEAMRSYQREQQAAQELANAKASYQNQLSSMNGAPVSMNLNYGVVPKSTDTTTSNETVPVSNGNTSNDYSGDVGASAPTADYSSYLAAYEDYMRQAAEAQQRALEEQYQRSLEQLQNAFNRNKTTLNTSADDAKRQAYINYMTGRRNLSQELANNGLTGGASESIMANLYNTYGNNRAAIDRDYANALEQLGAQYEQGVATLGNNYGGEYADVLSNLYDNLATHSYNYASDLAKALGKNSVARGNLTTASADNNAYNPDEVVRAIQTVGANRAGLQNALGLYGVDLDSNEGQRLLLQAGYDPTALVTGNNGINVNNAPTIASSITPSSTRTSLLSSTPGASAMLRSLQSKYSTQGEQAALNYLNGLRQQGYSEDLIRELISASGY